MRLSFTTLCFLVCTAPAIAQFEPPASYYNSATGTGATLKQQLHNIIDNHTVKSYGDARTILQDTDVDPNDSDRMLLAYDRTSLDVSSIGGSIPGWDSAASWNREHTWPRSLGVGSSGPDNSDLHQLRPCETDINSDRGSLSFGGAFGQSFGTVNDGGTKWYPGDADAGMIARQQFYVAVRYDGSDSGTVDLELTTGSAGSSTLGDLDRLIEWHFAAPADDFELRRNDRIYDSYQFNRNPFVDRPEYAWSVLIDQQNDSRVAIAGTSVASDGGSTLEVDLGRAYVGQAGPAMQPVTLNKSGLDGTYYEVAATGLATHSLPDGFLAFRSSQTDSVAFDVGLNASTSTAGTKVGALVVDNLDITTQGGPGRGANDAVDTFNLNFEVLNHPVASLVADSEVRSHTIDVGPLTIGSGEVAIAAGEIANLLNSGPAFASNLDLDSILGSGDTTALSLDLAPFSDLEQGSGVTFDALVDTSTAGMLSATFDLLLSGEDLPGEQTQTLSLTVLAEVVEAGLAGDFNNDGHVDAADYTVWRDGFPVEYDQQDFLNWRDHYGDTSVSEPLNQAAVPEPAALLLAAIALSGMPRSRLES